MPQDDEFEGYIPSSPQYDPSSPQYSANSPQYAPTDPEPSDPQDTAFPIDALAPDVRALFQHMECAVCLDLQSDMLVVCESGHSVCKVCYDGVCMTGGPGGRKCPSCRTTMANPRPNLAVNGVVAALGIQPRSAASAPPAAPAAAPPVYIDDQRRQWDRLRRSLLGKVKCRARNVERLDFSLRHGLITLQEASRRKLRLLNQVAFMGSEWRRNTNLPFPIRMQEEISEAFNLHTFYVPV